MKSKIIKTLSILILTLLVVLELGTTGVQAVSTIISPGNLTASTPSTSALQSFGSKVLGIVQTVGVILAVIILAILGIKYMMGSAEEKAEYKKTFIPYIVGAVLVGLAPTIAGFIFELL